MRHALIAAGSNSCRLLIVRRDAAGVTPEHHDIRGTRLGEGLSSSGTLAPAAMARTLDALVEFATLGRQADDCVAIGTCALREATNAAAFVAMMKERTGLTLRILTGEEEAQAAFEGAVFGLESAGIKADALTVVDVGGASTELAVAARFSQRADERAVNVATLPLGSVRLTERFVKHDPPSPPEIAAIATCARLDVERLKPELQPHGTLVAVGGTADTAARMLSAYESSEGTQVAKLRLEDIADLRKLASSLTIAERKRLRGLPESRADIFPAGLVILEEIAAAARASELLVTEADLMLGYLLRSSASSD